MQRATKAMRMQAFAVDAGASGVDGNVFMDVDIVNCHSTLMWNAFVEYAGEEGAAEFNVLRSFVQRPQDWKDFVSEYLGVDAADAKKTIISLIFLGLPKCDIPFLWTVAVQVHKVAELLVSSPKYRRLNDMFEHRRRPIATRLSYALQSIEDCILQNIEDEIAASGLNARVVIYMFDKAAVALPMAKRASLVELLAQVGHKWSVKFHVADFPVHTVDENSA